MLLCKLSPRFDHFHRRQGKSSARESLAYLGDQRTFYGSRPEKDKAVLVRRRSYHHSRRPGHSKSCGVERVECCQLLESRRGTLLWTIHRHAGGPRKKGGRGRSGGEAEADEGVLRGGVDCETRGNFRGLRGSSIHASHGNGAGCLMGVRARSSRCLSHLPPALVHVAGLHSQKEEKVVTPARGLPHLPASLMTHCPRARRSDAAVPSALCCLCARACQRAGED